MPFFLTPHINNSFVASEFSALDFLKSSYPAMKAVTSRASSRWVRPSVGIIENENFPDQTYDVWIASGVSAYTGGLWVASLFALGKVEEGLGGEGGGAGWVEKGRVAKRAYDKLLWNEKGGCFNYSSENSESSKSIMADQLCGQWWTQACGLEDVVEDRSKVERALRTIYKNNVVVFGEKYDCGGAVNGFSRSGTVDNSCLQSREVWTGTTYGLSACMIQNGLFEEGMKTAEGIFESGWKRYGFSFATPEAWDCGGGVRSLGYMRPLCIWAMADAAKKEKS